MAGLKDFIFLHSPTMMDMTDNVGNQNNRQNLSQRTSINCYIRGISENLHMETNSSTTWKWRRIVFTCQGTYGVLFPQIVSGAVDGQPYVYGETATQGFVRMWRNYAELITNKNFLTSFLFRGAEALDWTDIWTARVDTRRVKVLYDSRRVIQSQSATGVVKSYKLWHQCNKNLKYADDEQGTIEAGGPGFLGSPYSVISPSGTMGDLMIYDYFRPAEIATSSDSLTLSSTSEFYWHER